MIDGSTIQSIFGPFGSEDSLLPFFGPLTLWVGMYTYSHVKGTSYQDWPIPHNTHHFFGMIFATLSIIYDNEEIFPERVGVLWTLSFFVIDFIDCVRVMHTAYLFHAVCVLFLSSCNLMNPSFYRLRMNSRAMYLELSSPFMHLSKKTRNPLHFAIFALMFTCCRVVWIPLIMKRLLDDGLPWTDYKFLVVIAFYGLNLFWYAKILRIIIFGPPQKEDKKEG
ncbi:unnamed protein product [Cylindrotheca closterium]|uniref:TLC domain-containing protein n=1 Tax=Cylindrotheca closterium TaxID=2856 RepID=A0AAD2CUU1_9STRA|nr:unnamed protein product [Cylindrotheca closterium]